MHANYTTFVQPKPHLKTPTIHGFQNTHIWEEKENVRGLAFLGVGEIERELMQLLGLQRIVGGGGCCCGGGRHEGRAGLLLLLLLLLLKLLLLLLLLLKLLLHQLLL